MQDYAFQNCDLIEEIVYTKGITSVGSCAFQNCKKLNNLELLGALNSIGNYAFQNAGGLKRITISENLTSIGSHAFENCTSLTDVYLKGNANARSSISFGTDWDKNTKFYMHKNVGKYGVYIGLNAAKVEIADMYYALLPVDYEHTLYAYDTETGDILPFRDIFPQAGGLGKFDCYEDEVSGSKGGHALLKYGFVANDLETIRFMVVENHPDVEFSGDEIDYIAFCIEMYFYAMGVSDPDDIVGTDMSVLDVSLLTVKNFTKFFAGYFEGDLSYTVLTKDVLAKFIKEYVNNEYAHYKSVDDTKMILAGWESAKQYYELYKDNETWIKLPADAANLIEELYDLHLLAEFEKITKDQLMDATKALMQLMEIPGMDIELSKMDAWHEALADTRKSINECHESLRRLDKFFENDSIYGHIQNGQGFKLIKDNTPGALETGLMALDSLIYIACDYTNNIEVLEKMSDGIQNSCKDTALRKIFLNAINELIEEYENHVVEGISDFFLQFGAETIINIMTRHPYFTLAKFAAGIIVEVSSIQETAELIILQYYADSLEDCISEIEDLYFKGIISSDAKEIEEFGSMYVSILLKSTKLAKQIADKEFNNGTYVLEYGIDDARAEYEDDIAELNEIQETLETIIQKYFS